MMVFMGFRAFPERKQRGMVEILAMGVAVDHGAAELQFVDTALQFVRRRARILHRQMRETRIALRMPADFPGQNIIGGAGLPDRGCSVAFDLDAGP
jgi:hypothetical protein